MLEQWVIDKLNPLKGEKLIVLADPQRMIRAGAQAVDGWAKDNGFTVLFCSGNLALREMYENLRNDTSAKIILVDRSREKAKLPLFYPDLEARCKPKARLTITLRDFLVERTGDQRWPPLVNSDRNLSRLVLDHQEKALDSYGQLRDVDEHRFQDSDLYKIVLGATLNVNPFEILKPAAIRRLCIENHERLEQIKDLFSSGVGTEASEVLAHLKGQIEKAEKPWCWMLDHDPQAVVRAFTLAAVLHQHGLEYEVLLPNFDTSLEPFKAIPKRSLDSTIKDMLRADPDQIANDVAAVEEFLKEEPQKRLTFLLADRLKLDQRDEAFKVLLKEKLSSLVRSMALLSLLTDLLVNRQKDYHKGVLSLIDEEGTKGKEDTLSIAARRPPPQWATLLATYRRAIQFLDIADKLKAQVHKLKVLMPDQLQIDQFLQLWNEEKANRLDYYTSGLRRLVQVGDILPVPKGQFWPQLTLRWEAAQQKLNESIKAVDQDVDAANAKFQDLYHANYVKWINRDDSPLIFTHQFVSRVLKTHWDAQSGQKAVVLIFDGLRVDAWEELVRPVLEEKYDVLDRLPGSAILPSETHLSRKAISAGCLPVAFSSTSENALMEYALKTNLNLTVKFKVKSQNEAVECGITAHYTSDPIDVVIFNFTDKNLHNNPADLSFIYDTTVREILRQDVRSVLREMPDNATVFVTSDHGFTPVPEPTFTVPDGVLTDSGDVKYRVGRLKRPLEGSDSKKGVLFKVGDLGIPDKTGKTKWSFNHILFPRPGLTLKRPQGKHNPERYTHGGLSMAECMIPMIVLGPKVKFEPAFDLVGIRFEGVLSEGQPLDILITAKAKTPVKEELLLQLQVDAGLDDIQPRKEVFTGTEQEYRVRWTPKVDNPTTEEQATGKVVKQVTAIASYRWQNRTLRTTVHGRVEIQLDTTRIRRRLDSKLDSIMGMVPAGLR
ncbi:PglZ domain-containing protein [Fimbriiglobus ruber]|uniref:Two-component response regulator n=1 Tax=Fimbriiglobus ruber TaxID=1908690 RepID=A0A225E7L9_9BACT|nr:PglZ domain-containing protein [Fimbriiglobus ruber]OWK45509.1 Two-component response regulator [Fimbriiglobus ruber]